MFSGMGVNVVETEETSKEGEKPREEADEEARSESSELLEVQQKVPAKAETKEPTERTDCDGDGLPVFDRLRARRHDRDVFLFAFDLLELDGRDLRRQPIENRKAPLTKLLRGTKPGLQLNEHIGEPGDIVFRHACKLGLEGILSKRIGSRYRSGRSRDWIKLKNPNAPAVKREAEEDWGR